MLVWKTLHLRRIDLKGDRKDYGPRKCSNKYRSYKKFNELHMFLLHFSRPYVNMFVNSAIYVEQNNNTKIITE
jgi:hypothetical protein